MEVNAPVGGRISWAVAFQVGIGCIGLGVLLFAAGLGFFGSLADVAAAVPAIPFAAAWLAFAILALPDRGWSRAAVGSAISGFFAAAAAIGLFVLSRQAAGIAAHGVWTPTILAGVAAGGAAMAFLLSHDAWPARARMAARAGNLVVLALALLVAVNAYAARTYRMFDWTRVQLYAMSEKTVRLLQSLDKDLEVIAVSPAFERSDPEEAARQEGMRYMRDLLERFHEISPRVRIDWIDPYADKRKTLEVIRKFSLREQDLAEQRIILAYDGRTKSFSSSECVEIEYPDESRMRARLKSFTGEAAFMAALIAVKEERLPIVYAAQGRGELAFDDFSGPRAGAPLRNFLERSGFKVRTFEAAAKAAVPADCDVLIVAGPQKPYPPAALQAFERYLDGGGKALILWDAIPEVEAGRVSLRDAGLSALLGRYGVLSESALVVDAAVIGEVSGQTLVAYQPDRIEIPEFGRHPIVKGLSGQTALGVSFARPLRPGKPKDDLLEAIPLAQTSQTAFALPERDIGKDAKPPAKPEGLIPVAFAVQPKDSSDDPAKRKGRTSIVVVGDSDLAAGEWLGRGGNQEFLNNALQWLASRQEIVEGIAPKTPESTRFEMGDSSRRWFGLVLGIGPAFLVGWAGFFVYALRSGKTVLAWVLAGFMGLVLVLAVLQATGVYRWLERM